ncbi:Z1 domain-containing protein [Nocardioides sp. AX2bis]|uniref:Z1 domain-containing protein n=1 Tax=Nocardioides sp. AX2bis TaxID=2653157 RepID=UPI0019152FB7|nr:Z1 domain-containing protein [Nocardioides sp. AX2bis]
MLGVAAKSLDSGVDAVVVLAGTRVALWRQTLDRLVAQLDQPGPERIPAASRRTLVPSLSAASADDEAPSLSRLYGVNGPQARRMISKRRPLVCVTMKNVHHVRALADMLRNQLWPAVTSAGRPFHLLVLDDEADDGSILDARIEQSVDPVLGDLKQIPRSIVDLWASRPHRGSSASPSLYVTYVGYTATPQANFLQYDHNPLAPRDFVAALRTPYDRGTIDPRRTTYLEPNGLHNYYTGGEAFYRQLPSDTLVREPHAREVEATRIALFSFLLAGAIRLWRDPSRLGPRGAREAKFETADEARQAVMRPHTMLVHPSAAIADQYAAASTLLRAAGLESREAADAWLHSGQRALPTEALLQSLTDQPAAWREALVDFRTTAQQVASAYGLPSTPAVPDDSQWNAVEAVLRDQIIPGTRFAVVNSDPTADDRPSFEPSTLPDEDGWAAARDLCTVFVSGNVMSRGLTLEGLATSLFLRRSDEPMADTQMQMQRWFGYRGRDLELCRVFVPAAQQDLFRAYHEADEALRRDVLDLMDEDTTSAPKPQVLQGRGFIATGKLANIRNVPLCPGAFPFIRLMNRASRPDPNINVVHDAFSRPSQDLVVSGRLRGRLLNDTLDLLSVATLLDSLAYENYHPGGDEWETRRWSSVASHAGLTSANDNGNAFPLYRAPAPPNGGQPSSPRRDCPYAIAAYLRLWSACLTRHARGLVPTDSPRIPWSMIDLRQRQATQPCFRVGIRYGSGSPAASPPLTDLPFQIPTMKRDVNAVGDLAGTWGTRNPGVQPDAYLGDSFFDYHADTAPHSAVAANGTIWRPAGAPGLLLFHIVDRAPDQNPTVAVGLAIPLGGPDQFAARTT